MPQTSSSLCPGTQTLIVGGGIIGLSLAWELSTRGRRVVVIDAQGIGRGASWAGAGILPPTATCPQADDYENLRALSHRLHPLWAKRLRQSTGIDTGLRRCGGVYLARSPAEMATLTANQLWWQMQQIEYQQWTMSELAQREPSLGRPEDPIRGAWFLPDEYQLRNPRHLQALAAACQQQGVQLIEAAAMESLEIAGGAVEGVTTARGRITAEQVCICSGAWARLALEQLNIANGILPVRGQIVLYRCPQPPIHSVINEGHRYLVAREDGHLLAGSVEEEVGYHIHTTAEALAQIRGWAEQILPSLKQCPVEKCWAGLRPGSFDGLPYLGRVPGIDNLFLAAGHYRNGLHLSCATAVVLANEMLQLPNDIDLHPFRVGRG
ncbi:MAG: glycine oxidase ThiO [Planctomycetales bacterium]|nr:glycine oxidase ThiO [Planctomycetales bacterium]